MGIPKGESARALTFRVMLSFSRGKLKSYAYYLSTSIKSEFVAQPGIQWDDSIFRQLMKGTVWTV
jgi:hypothetical protein